MKEIRAIIRPQKLPKLREALRALPGFPGMSISKAEGFGAPSQHTPHNIKEELTDYSLRTRIEIIAPDELADAIFDCVVRAAKTGQTGDGLVWMVPVERAAFIHKTTIGSPEG
ncbi:MAG: P-II family nitrogen regulator [Zoogloea sp.]|nr:P-II family nitrogen regulator [Zoogloea sp.]